MMMSSRLKARLGRVLVISLLAVPTASFATSALAAGTSTATNNCVVQWWTTAWVGKCVNATQSGSYKAHVARADQADYNGPWRSVTKGSTATFDSGEASRGVQANGNSVSYTS